MSRNKSKKSRYFSLKTLDNLKDVVYYKSEIYKT